ncbi:hypothetical protein ACJRO7_034537 [Eucalyptus globulus]|uniref:Uncharacterized protein n=1 Tax=Eucalyptus globulus TaxID=34317 RepID=A0ABD3J6W5_EUCGL
MAHLLGRAKRKGDCWAEDTAGWSCVAASLRWKRGLLQACEAAEKRTKERRHEDLGLIGGDLCSTKASVETSRKKTRGQLTAEGDRPAVFVSGGTTRV